MTQAAAHEVKTAEQILTRPAMGADLAFICDSWLKSHRHDPGPRMLRSSVFFQGHKPIIENLLLRCGATVVHYHEYPDEILGWICGERIGEQFVAHYAYTKSGWRGSGFFATALTAIGYVPGEEITATHTSKHYRRDKFGRYPVTNNPYLLMELLK